MDFHGRSTVTILTLALATASLAAGPAARDRARVEAVAVHDGAAPAVEITLSRPVESALHRLGNPPRVYVDLKDALLAPAVARAIEGSGAVRKVRLGQFDSRTVRVVVELATAGRAEIEAAGKVLRIAVGAGAAPAKSAAAPSAATASIPRAAAGPPAPAPAAAAAEDAARPDAGARLAVARTEEALARPRPAARPTLASNAIVTLEERIARRCAAEDWPGVVALYAADTRAVRHDVDATTRAAVVDALRELGLVYSARKLLGPAGSAEAPALRVARAELALADGEAKDAAAHVAGIDEKLVDPALAPKLRELRVRLALAQGDLEAAAAGIGNRAAPGLRAELATTALGAGRAASDGRTCRPAIAAYRRALDADGGRTARAAAAAGLVRAALACEDPDATMAGLGVLAESPHPLLRRAAAIIAATQTDAKRQVAGVRRGG